MVLLAIPTNLPEIEITVSAALSGNVEVALGNLLGGIALVVAVLLVVVAGTQLPDTLTEQKATSGSVSTARAATVLGVAALLMLVAGVTIERSGEQFFGDLGLSGVLFGATVLAAATACRSCQRA